MPKEGWLFLTSRLTTGGICNNTFINHVDIIYEMIRRGICGLDVLRLQICSIRNLGYNNIFADYITN